MKKSFAALVAVATIAGALAATPASAQRGLGAAVAGGIIGGAIVGGAIAATAPRRPIRSSGYVRSGAALPLGSSALLGWLRMGVPPRAGLQLI